MVEQDTANPRKRAREDDDDDTLLAPHEQAIENHNKQLVTSIASLYNRHCALSDVCLQVGNPPRRFDCHRLILALQSPVFQAMLYGNFRESLQSEISLEDVCPDTFAKIHQYIYTGLIDLDLSNALSLIMLADRFGLTTLTSECVKMVRACLTHDNVFRIMDQYSAVDDLRKGCIAYIGDHAATLLTSDTVLDLSEEMLAEVLRSDHLVAEEIDLFKLIVRWGEHRIRMLTGETSTPATPVTPVNAQGGDKSTPGSRSSQANGSASTALTTPTSGNGKEPEKLTLKAIVANLIELIRLPMISPQQLWDVVAKSGVVDEVTCIRAIAAHSVPQVIGTASPVRRCARAITYLEQGPKTATIRYILDRYSAEAEKQCIYSPHFEVGGHKWRLFVGSNTQCKKKFAIYLDLLQPELKLEPEASFSLHICKFTNPKDRVTKTADKHKFTEEERDWGFTNFINTSDLRKYLHDNSLMIEADITVE